MELEQLQSRWRLLDQKLDRTLAMQASLLRQVHLEAARRHINRLAVWPTIDLAFGIVVLLAAGSCLGDHWTTASLSAPAAALMAAAILFLVGNILQLKSVLGIAWDGPITDIQRVMGGVRRARIRQLKWIVLLSPLVWFCLMCVGGELFFGLNVIQAFSPLWTVANIGLGILFVPVGMWLARSLSRRGHDSSFWRTVLDDVSGRSLTAAQRELDRWAAMANEQPPVQP